MYRLLAVLLIALPAVCDRRSDVRHEGRPHRKIRHAPATQIAFVSTPLEVVPSVEVAFSPNGGATDLVISAINEARSTIRLAAYEFTSRPIALALLEAKTRGVDVEAVVDKASVNGRSAVATLLAREGVPIRVNHRQDLMHLKTMVIDGQTVETGSFNYTSAAETRNAENVLVIRNSPALAQQYVSEWRVCGLNRRI